MNKDKLFIDFPSVATIEWEDKIKKDLKGADYEKKLVTKTIDGFYIKPYYRCEDIRDLEYLNIPPGKFPFVRGNKTSENNYLIRQNIFVDDYKQTNKKAIDIIGKGVTSLGFVLEKKKNIAKNDFFDLLNNINISKIEINFIAGTNSIVILKLLEQYVSLNISEPASVVGSIDFNPFAHLSKSDKCCVNEIYNETKDIKSLFYFAEKNIPNIKILSVNASLFRNAGVTAVQEVAFAMAMGSDYLERASEIGIEIDKLCQKIIFTFGTGSNYFIEIAKIRAARLLWAKIVRAYNPDSSGKMYVHSVTCDCNKTANDPFINVLRTTSETMSAIIGGADSLLVNPFDKNYKEPNDFSEKIARNISIILKEEAYFDKAIDPAAGAYYIENLTNSIAEHAWKLFVEIENEGGWIKTSRKNIISG